LLSYFSKQKQSEVKQERVQQGLRLEFSGHPNQISLKTPFRVKLNLGNKPASGFQVALEIQATTLGEPEKAIQLQTNGSGEATLPFSAVGQVSLLPHQNSLKRFDLMLKSIEQF